MGRVQHNYPASMRNCMPGRDQAYNKAQWTVGVQAMSEWRIVQKNLSFLRSSVLDDSRDGLHIDIIHPVFWVSTLPCVR